jgi:drug/metabolite transporter superfamily protein YnfA
LVSERQGFAVIGTRTLTGFGGIFVVTALLLLAQIVTGVKAFPL